MKVQYLEIVSNDVPNVCRGYEAALNLTFSEPDPILGHARVATLPNGALVGVRGPLRDTEEPLIRPYWLVDDIETALAAVVSTGAEVAHPPLELPGKGTFAIYIQGGTQQGLWQL